MKIRLVKDGKARVVDVDYIEAVVGTVPRGNDKARIRIMLDMPSKNIIQLRGVRAAFRIVPRHCNVMDIEADPR